MQKIATKIFIYASILFGVLGIANIIVEPEDGSLLFKLLFCTGFVVLSSFAISVAGKYLNGKL